ncbi:hypothetical protein [Nocardioides sp.]|uniref:hypothetical protein n=1 Tax=Nocardioides sp. TaxID=35761 RepID=UPI0031FE54CA
MVSYSTANDGSADSQNTVTLLAGFPNALAGGPVNTVKFSYTNGTGSHDIATVVPVDGLATTEWVPPTGVDGDTVSQVRADALDASNVSIANSTEAMNGDPNPNANPAISLDGALRSDLGLNPDGEVVLRGLTAVAPPANVLDAYPNVSGWIVGPRTQSAAAAVRSGNTLGSGLTPWAAQVLVDPTNLTADPVDEVVGEGINSVAGVDDVNAYSVYDAVINAITKPTTAGHGPNLAGNADGVGSNTDDWTLYNLTVTDQKNQPLSGVNVYESDESGVDLAGFNGMGRTPTDSGTFDTDETNVNGQLPIRLNESGVYGIDGIFDQDATAGVGATYVVVDWNQNGSFQGGIDTIVKLTASTLPQAPATVTITSSRGVAMDDDENTDLTITVKDSNGDPVPNFAVSATNTRDVADNSPADSTTPIVLSGGGITDANGQVKALGYTPGVDNNEVAATIKATAGAITGTLAIETDEAEIVFDEGNVDQALNGTSVTETGTVQLPSGTVLPGRSVSLVYGPNGNSSFAPQAEQPAGTISGTPTTANATTGADGKFAVKVTDPALPNGQELGSTITADLPGLNLGGGESDLPEVLTLDFLRSLTATSVVIYNDDNGATSTVDGLDGDFENQQSNGGLLPDSMAEGGITAFNADGVTLTDLDVTVTIDQGHFSKRDDPFKATPAPGAIFEMNDIGKTITINTTDDGIGEFYANIERNTGFDDDGIVEDQLHASVGSVSDDHDFTWTTVGTPITQRQTDGLVVSLSGDQQSSILPQARAGTGNSAQAVFYDVKTYDHYDNPTSQEVSVTDNTPVGEIADPDGLGPFESELALGQPAIVATSPSTANQAIDVEINNSQKRVYKDNVNDSSFDPANPNDQVEVLFTDVQRTTDPINWYTVNLNDPSLYTLTQEGSENVPVGSTVSYTLTAIDPEGQPINGSGVGFLRVGPGDQGQDDDGQAGDVTNADGEAFYDFAGSVPGTASVSAVVYDDEGIIGLGGFHRLFVVGPDTVTFGGTVVAIHPRLTGENSGGKDVLTINSRKAAGASVKLFKKTGHGRVLLKVGQLNVNGIKSFKVTDKNGNQVTKYFAIVSNTPRTQRGVTNTVNLR